MKRRHFVQSLAIGTLAGSISATETAHAMVIPEKPASTRDFWIETLVKIADPVLISVSRGKLKERMPVECKPGSEESRKKVSHLEAVGRLMCGIAPWLELGPGEDTEGRLRAKYIQFAVNGIANITNPSSPDFLNFTEGGQPLVDAAFLAHALLRSPRQLWGNLTPEAQTNVIAAFKSSRVIKPYMSNWLLFSAMVEIALLKFTGECNMEPVTFALDKHFEWYKGDGMYGDGPEFHFDYYNSFVIQPMMLDILNVLSAKDPAWQEKYERQLKISARYAEIQERLISPEATFPAIGRSLPYRFGAFQLLSQMALWEKLPESVKPEQVRCALTAVIKRQIAAPNTFNKDGWLQIGFYGHQPDIAESYISTGSLYLCSAVFLPLGLPKENVFWSEPDADWTEKKIWSGQNVRADHALSL